MKQPNRFWRWILAVAALGYPLTLLAIVLAFRLVGERWWVTTAALYLPRLPLAAPLPVLVLALALARSRRLLLAQLVALLLLVPLLGFKLSLPRHPTEGASRLRILSFNIYGEALGVEGILAAVHAADPDIVLFQAVGDRGAPVLAAGLPGYHVHSSGQFFLASRYPILEATDPPRISYQGQLRSPRFMRYRLLGPTGPIRVYSVHPPSPREGLSELYGDGLRAQIDSGHLIANPQGMGLLSSVAGLRTAQMCTVASDAGGSPDPVLIAGDTNLPGSSWAFSHCFGGFQDGFATVGNGFGYTFPSTKRRRPWMRIDRVLADDRSRFLGFEVGPGLLSDHQPVIADLELAAAGKQGAGAGLTSPAERR